MLGFQPLNLGLLAGSINSSRAINTAGAESVIYLQKKREYSLENRHPSPRRWLPSGIAVTALCHAIWGLYISKMGH